MPSHDDSWIHELSRDLEFIEESTRIIQEIETAGDVEDVRDILERHRSFYLGLSCRARSLLNERIKDAIDGLPNSK